MARHSGPSLAGQSLDQRGAVSDRLGTPSLVMTVLEVIQRSSAFLKEKGVDSPRLQVELLLAKLLGMRRLDLYLKFERQLTEPELAAFRQWVQRRGAREPLQHLLGSTSFCGYEMEVNGEVLVPRPETELLAEQASLFLKN